MGGGNFRGRKGRPIVNPQPIEMPFGLWALMGPWNHVLDGVSDPPWEGAILGERVAHCEV